MALIITQADIDTVKQALIDGATMQSIKLGDQTFTFTTVDDKLTLLAWMQSEFNAALALAGGGAPGYRLAATSKGA